MSLSDDLQEEKKWLIQEAAFFGDLHQEVTEILKIKAAIQSNEGSQREALRDLLHDKEKEISRTLRKVGRSERRRIRYEKRLLGKLHQFENQEILDPKELEKIVESVQIFSGRILREIDYRDGRIQILGRKKEPDLAKIEDHESQIVLAISSLLAILEKFEQIVSKVVSYHSEKDILKIMHANPALQQKVCSGELPLYYYHATKPHLVGGIFKSGCLAPEMRSRIKDVAKYKARVQEEISIYKQITGSRASQSVLDERRRIRIELHHSRYEPITSFVQIPRAKTFLTKEIFPDYPSIETKGFFPYFDDKLEDLCFLKFEKKYVKKLNPEDYEHITRKIQKLIEKRIDLIKKIASQRDVDQTILADYIKTIRRAYLVFPHAEYLIGDSILERERTMRKGYSAVHRWAVKFDRWFIFFAADPPFKAQSTYHYITSWLVDGTKDTCIFEFKPTLYEKISWEYVGTVRLELMTYHTIFLRQYCSRIYCHKEKISHFRKLAKDAGLDVDVCDYKEQPRIHSTDLQILCETQAYAN